MPASSFPVPAVRVEYGSAIPAADCPKDEGEQLINAQD
jgi:hypothetical protein